LRVNKCSNEFVFYHFNDIYLFSFLFHYVDLRGNNMCNLEIDWDEYFDQTIRAITIVPDCIVWSEIIYHIDEFMATSTMRGLIAYPSVC